MYRPGVARAAVILACATVAVSVTGCGTSAPKAAQSVANIVRSQLPSSGSGPSAAQIPGFRWARLATSPLGARSQPLLVWAGGELLELGGQVKGGSSEQGAAFDLATGRWHRIATADGDVDFPNAVSAWTGRELFVVNGQSGSCFRIRGDRCWSHADLYDPASNRWTATRLPGQLAAAAPTAAVWTGRDVVLAGADYRAGRLAVATYDPVTGRWQVITPALPPHHPAQSAVMLVVGGRLILWSLWDRVTVSGNSSSGYSGVDVLTLGPEGGWRNVTGHWPQSQLVNSPVSADGSILVSPSGDWCGFGCSPPAPMNDLGYFADPTTLARTMIPVGPLGQVDPSYLWTGRAIIAVNVSASAGGRPVIRPDDMALWDLTTHRWLSLPAAPGRPGLAATPIWTGTELLALTNGGQLFAFRR